METAPTHAPPVASLALTTHGGRASEQRGPHARPSRARVRRARARPRRHRRPHPRAATRTRRRRHLRPTPARGSLTPRHPRLGQRAQRERRGARGSRAGRGARRVSRRARGPPVRCGRVRAPPAVQAPRATPLTGRDVPRGTLRSPAVTQRHGSRRSTCLALSLGTSEQGWRSRRLRTHQVHRASPRRTTRAPRAPARVTRGNVDTGSVTARRPPAASSAGDLRRQRPEERGDGVCPSALGNSASFVDSPPDAGPGEASGLDLLAGAAASTADAASTAASTTPPPILDPDGRPFGRNRRGKRPADDAATSDERLKAVQRLTRALRASEALPPRDVTTAVAHAYGTPRPYASTHVAIAAAAFAALHEELRVANLPAHLRCSASSMGTWRTKLDPALAEVTRRRPEDGSGRRPAEPHHAADLRAELPEERGEGDAASAFCTSASHTVRAPQAQRGPPPPPALADIYAAGLPLGHPRPSEFRTRSPGADRRAPEGFAPRPGRQATVRAHSTPDAP